MGECVTSLCRAVPLMKGISMFTQPPSPGGADFVLTMNVKDFPGGDACPYEVYTPGEFFTLVWDSAPGLVERVCREMDCYRSRKGRSGSIADCLRSVEGSVAMQKFAQRVTRALCDR